MIDLEDIRAAYDDICGAGSEEGFALEDIQMRFEMLDIDFDSFRVFLFSRLSALDEIHDFDPEWSRGYVHAAMEFFLYGDLCGKEAALNNDLSKEINDE